MTPVQMLMFLIVVINLKSIQNAPMEEKDEIDINTDFASWDPSHPQNPEEFGEYFEGDIMTKNIARNGIVGDEFRWKNGQIPYEISNSFSTRDQKMINKAMELYEKYTCVSFRPKVEADKDYVLITNYQSGCWSNVGKKGGVQEVNLQSPQCTTKIGTAIHELMHAAGFLHEQNRHERDDFVTIQWKNIKKGKENNFNKANKDYAKDYGIPYDFISVMHYSSTAFSSNGKQTITPKQTDNIKKMGQRDGFSRGDITKINAMYNCPEKTEQLNITGDITTETIDGSSMGNNSFWQSVNSLFSLILRKFHWK